MLAEWIKSLDKIPQARTDDDLEIIFKKLKTFKLFRKVHPSVIQQLCFVAIIEHIEKGVVLCKQGEEALNWYALLYGSLDVQVSNTGKRRDITNICTLCSGTAFGECVLTNEVHSVTLVTNEPSTLLRIRKSDFQDIWRKSSHLMEDIVTSPFTNMNKHNSADDETEVDNLAGNPLAMTINSSTGKPQQNTQITGSTAQRRASHSKPGNIEPEAEGKTEDDQLQLGLRMPENILKLMHVGWVMRSAIQQTAPHLIRDRKHPSSPSSVFDKCFIASELTDWLMNITGSSAHLKVRSRKQAQSMLQVLHESGIIASISPREKAESETESCFTDSYAFCRFCFDDDSNAQMLPLMGIFRETFDEQRILSDYLFEMLTFLVQKAPEANLRHVLRKKPETRTEDDNEIIYEEAMNVKGFSHLSNTVKKELAAVLTYEHHRDKGTTLFKQGDRGTCWYIILKGSVNVVIASKGVVCSLHTGDDFGKLALVNEAPRAATIITAEADCELLRIEKVHFDRILKDNEANTVRLKEHGKEVLVLQKMSLKQIREENSTMYFKYKVMAGTPEKVLEHLLETRMNAGNHEEQFNKESLFEDFLLNFPIFLSWRQMTTLLLRHYKIDEQNFRQMENYIIENKKRYARFIIYWYKIAGEAFLNTPVVWPFIDEILDLMEKDNMKYCDSFQNEIISLRELRNSKHNFEMNLQMRGVFVWKADNANCARRLSNINENVLLSLANSNSVAKFGAIKDFDEIICRVYCADHTYTTFKITMKTKADSIKNQAAEKLNLDNSRDYILVELKSDNEKVVFNETELNIPTTLSLNGRIFISHVDHLDALTTLPEQEGPSVSSIGVLENYSSQDIAYYLSTHSWKLFSNIHPYEFIYHVFGRHNFSDITANLDLLRRHYSELQFWVITELLLEKTLSRRVLLLKKFIKVAGYCREYKNFNAFFAIISGLSNVAVSRLTQTWERLHSKLKRIFTQYESLIDSSRNYRKYRLLIAKYTPPYIPYVPLLIRDMTSVHEGNKTFVDQGLVNFEKMHLLGETLRMIQECKSGTFEIDSPVNLSAKKMTLPVSLQDYFEQLRMIDNQKRLMQLSYALEHRKV